MLSLKKQKSLQENLLVILENTVKFLKIEVSKSSLESVKYLPDFPSLYSLATALRNWGVNSMAVELELKELLSIDYPIIAHLSKYGGHFVLITGASENMITYHDPEIGWVTEPSDTFSSRWSGVCLLLEVSEKSGEFEFHKNYKKEKKEKLRKTVGAGLAIILVFGSLFKVPFGKELLIALQFVLGIVLSILLIAADLGNKITEKLCRSGKALDCYTVLDSPAATLFGWLKISDIGLVWFSGGYLAIWLASLSGQLLPVLVSLALLSTIAVGYVPFSIIYQGLKLRKWCMLCLGVQIILMANFVLLSPFLADTSILFSTNESLYLIAFSLLISVFSWISLKPVMNKNLQIPALKKNLYKFRTNVSIFDKLLGDIPVTEMFPLSKEIKWGNNDAPVQLLIASNPFCKPCIDAHKKLEHLITQFPERLCIIIRFSIGQNEINNNATTVAKHLISLPEEQKITAVKDWYETLNYVKWSALYPTVILPESEEILREHQNWCNWADITYTPTIFLNGRRAPDIYTIDDICNYIKQIRIENKVTTTY